MLRVRALFLAFALLLAVNQARAFADKDISNLYRFYSQKYKAHFYTLSEAEKNSIISTYAPNEWRCEGVAWGGLKGKQAGSSPIFRFHSQKYQSHFYTISEKEKEQIIKSYPQEEWRYEGVAYYAFVVKKKNTIPVFRFYSGVNQKHFYTVSVAEKNKIIAGAYPEAQWRYEGIAWYANQPKGDLSCGNISANNGPEITVGLLKFSKSNLRENSLRIEANKPYSIKDKDGKTVAKSIPAKEETRFKYDKDRKFKVYNSIDEELVYKEVRLEAADGNNSDLVFEIKKPSLQYDKYRGKLKLRYSEASNKIWLIETVPLEQYLWGFGEITGTGSDEYDKVMLTAARTYAYWKIKYSTKYASEGFKVVPTPANQLYKGYVYEKKYGDIRKAAEATRGKIVKHKSGDIALSPYSSWTDGRTRSFEERWGSDDYPWCQSVDDPYGKHPSKSTSQLESEGNHMVGISAHGALNLAGEHHWQWDRILKKYLTDINIVKIY